MKPGSSIPKAVIYCAVVVTVYLLIAGRTTLWDRDEPRFSRATVEMVESGNWLYPTFNGNLRPDKPILIYWLMSVPVRILGANALACRFAGVIGTAVSGFLTYLIGRRLFDDRVGLWAIGILATSLLIMFIGTFATADAVLLPCMVGAMAVFSGALERERFDVKDFVLMSLALGLALLAKGPVGLLPVLAIWVTLVMLRKQVKFWRLFGPTLGAVVVAVMIFLAWAIPANAATEGEFYRQGIGHHVVDRILHPQEGHGGGGRGILDFLLYLPFYPAVIIGGFFPWVLHLGGGLKAFFRRQEGQEKRRALLIGWIVPTVVVMIFVSTKLAHYILFIWPALALCVAGIIRQAEENKTDEAVQEWLKAGTGFYGTINGGLALILMVGPWFLPFPMVGLKVVGILAGVILIVMGEIVNRAQKAGRFAAAGQYMLCQVAILWMVLWVGVLPGLESIKIPPKIAKAVVAESSDETPVVTYKFEEPTLNFYVGRHITNFRDLEEVIEWVKSPGNGVLIIPKAKFEGLSQEHDFSSLVTIASVEGINYSKGIDPLTVLALQKGGGS